MAGPEEVERGGRIQHLAAGSLSRRCEHAVYVWFSGRLDAGLVAGWEPQHLSSNRDGLDNLYQKLVNGLEEEELLLKSGEDKSVTSWSSDGRFLLYGVTHPKTRDDIGVLPLEGDRKPVAFLNTEFDEGGARFSPDGHWVAYFSDKSGQEEIYVRPFSMNSAGTAVAAGGKRQISSGVGFMPRWRGDGRELHYRSRGGKLMAVEITTQPAFRAGIPRPLGVSISGPLASLADGKRFPVAPNSGQEPHTVVLNWQAGLKK